MRLTTERSHALLEKCGLSKPQRHVFATPDPLWKPICAIWAVDGSPTRAPNARTWNTLSKFPASVTSDSRQCNVSSASFCTSGVRVWHGQESVHRRQFQAERMRGLSAL